MINPLAMLRHWYQRKITMYELGALDDHLLADMGIERDRIPDVALAAQLRVRSHEQPEQERPAPPPCHTAIPAE